VLGGTRPEGAAAYVVSRPLEISKKSRLSSASTT